MDKVWLIENVRNRHIFSGKRWINRIREAIGKQFFHDVIILHRLQRLRKDVLVLGSILSFCLLILQASTVQADNPVRIAVVSPMTGDDVSVQYRFAVLAAVKELAGGTLMGRPIEVSYHDDRCMANIAEKLAHDLVKNTPPELVIGHSCSASTLAAAPIYAANDVLQITPDSTHVKVTELGNSTLFRMVGRNDQQGKMAAQRIAKYHAGQKVGVLHTTRTYAKELAKITVNELETLGIQPVLVLQTERETGSYLAPIQALKNADVDVLYLVGGALDNGVFMRQLRLMGSSIQVLSSDTLFMQTFPDVAESAAEGVIFTFIPDLSVHPRAASARQALESVGVDASGYSLLAYAAVEVWIEAVRRAQSFESDAVASALRGAPVDSVLGPVRFDIKGDIISRSPPFVWYQWRSGNRVPLSALSGPDNPIKE